MRRKHDQREEARRLRAEGLSLKQIVRRVGVSLSSVSIWVRDVELTTDQQDKLRQRMGISHNREVTSERTTQLAKARQSKSDKCRFQRMAYQEQGRADAKGRSMGDLHLIGCMLYWAEGAKDRNVACISNSDPNIAKLFVQFMHKCFGIPLDEFAIHCHCYTNNGLTVQEIERYWLDVLGLPDCCLRKSIVDYRPHNSMGLKVGKIPYGTVHVRGGKTKHVQRVYGAIQEYGRFDEPSWLD